MQGCRFDIYIYLYIFVFFYMCILFTRQLTQAACGDNHDNTKYEDHVQKKEKETTVAHQSGTHGQIPRVWKGDMIIASPLKWRRRKRELPFGVFRKRGELNISDFSVMSSSLSRVLGSIAHCSLRNEQKALSPLLPSLLWLLLCSFNLGGKWARANSWTGRPRTGKHQTERRLTLQCDHIDVLPPFFSCFSLLCFFFLQKNKEIKECHIFLCCYSTIKTAPKCTESSWGISFIQFWLWGSNQADQSVSKLNTLLTARLARFPATKKVVFFWHIFTRKCACARRTKQINK